MSRGQAPAPGLILASRSPYRRTLLARLGLAFETIDPSVDETPDPEEAPRDLVRRLARAKAERVAQAHPGMRVIGSDQAAVCAGRLVTKPGDHETAVAQLRRASGREVVFLTAVCLLDGTRGAAEDHVDETRVSFRTLSHAVIQRYLERERPYDCAGSFKCEGLGIALFQRIATEDPTALQGLPLIWLSGALERSGLSII